jgi:hypothetical protein
VSDDDQADERRELHPVTVEVTAGGTTVTIRAHEPLATVAEVAANLLDRAAPAGQHRPVGFGSGSMVHVETPCMAPAEPYAGAPRPPADRPGASAAASSAP